MNATHLSNDPDVDFGKLLEANRRHDAAPHSVCMDPAVAYGKTSPTNKRCGFPPPPKAKRKVVSRFIDQWGNVGVELKEM